MGINLNRLTSIKEHIKKIKSATNTKQHALINNLAHKKLNNLEIHVKLFNTIIRTTYTYATPAWVWKKHELLEPIQNQYFRRIFLLPFNTPAFMLYAELGIKPMKFTLLKATFNFWQKI